MTIPLTGLVIAGHRLVGPGSVRSNMSTVKACLRKFRGKRRSGSKQIELVGTEDPDLADLPGSECESTGLSLLERLLMRLESIDGQLALIQDRIDEIFAVLERNDGP